MLLVRTLSLVLALAACAETPSRIAVVETGGSEACWVSQVEQAESINRRQAELLLALSYLQEGVSEQSAGLAGLRSELAALQLPSRDSVKEVASVSLESCEAIVAERVAQQASASSKLLVGEVEHVFLPNLGIELPARIDTGATTSSLDAKNIQTFERDGNSWVRFTLTNPETGEVSEVERLRSRRVRVVQSNTDEPERRPVIELLITVGRVTQLAEFTLSDRSHLRYPVLIGRNILQDVMVVDVSQSDIAPYERPAARPESEQGSAD